MSDNEYDDDDGDGNQAWDDPTGGVNGGDTPADTSAPPADGSTPPPSTSDATPTTPDIPLQPCRTGFKYKCDECHGHERFLPTWQGVAGVMYIIIMIAFVIILISQWSNWKTNSLWLLVLVIVSALLMLILAILTFYFRPCNNQIDKGCNKDFIDKDRPVQEERYLREHPERRCPPA